MNDVAWRVLRTLFQGLTGSGVLIFLNQFVTPALPPDLQEFLNTPERQAILLVILTALVSAAHNFLENHAQWFPTIGKVPTMTDRGVAHGVPTDARPTFPPS